MRPTLLEKRQAGFTLIELVMVIVLLGVLSALAMPRMFSPAGFTQRGFRDETMALLRYAQKTAIAQRRTVCVQVNQNGVVLSVFAANPSSETCPAATVVSLPNAPRGGSGLVAVPASFAYSPLGAPSAGVRLTLPDAADIIVAADTGYVHD